MIDTGCEINLLKENCIKDNVRRDKSERFILTGIGSGEIETKGMVKINIEGRETNFHLVHNTFPISPCGLLGMQFLRNNSATMTFSDEKITLKLETLNKNNPGKIVLPARSHKLIGLPINSELKEGYLQKIDAGVGVYLGENLVKNENGLAQIFAINTTLNDIELIVPPVQLQEFSVAPQVGNLIQVENGEEENKRLAERLAKILKALDFSHLNDEEKASLLEPISKFSYRFKLENDKLGSTNFIQHQIHTTDESPTFQRQYRPAEAHNKEILKQTSELLEGGLIEDSDSPYNSPVWIVPKKADSEGNRRWRMVVDFRQLNKKTIPDAYPLPNITHILDQLGGAKYFTILDLASGFHQVPMHPDSKIKTAFSTPFGHYHFNRMPFGLKNAPATFQRLMDKVLLGLQGTELFVYMDDIVIYARSLEEHTEKLYNLLIRLEKANLTLQPEKCSFLRKEVAYLGHVISQDGVKPDPKKVEAVRKFPRPRTVKNIKQFLGLAGYYRRFIPKFSMIAKPLTFLLKRGVRFSWTDTQQKAFDDLKDILCTFPVLQYPDFTQAFVVTTDASNYGIGGVLSQGNVGKDPPVAYASRTLSDTEINYSTIEKELLAIIFCVETFRPYLYGRRFTLVTDHRPLVWMHNIKNPGSKLLRWRLRLGEYDYDVIYKKGSANSNADALSRNPFDDVETEFDENFDNAPIDDLDPLTPTFRDEHKVMIVHDRPPVPSCPLTDRINNLIGRCFLFENFNSGDETSDDGFCVNQSFDDGFCVNQATRPLMGVSCGRFDVNENSSPSVDDFNSYSYFMSKESSDNSDNQYETAVLGHISETACDRSGAYDALRWLVKRVGPRGDEIVHVTGQRRYNSICEVDLVGLGTRGGDEIVHVNPECVIGPTSFGGGMSGTPPTDVVTGSKKNDDMESIKNKVFLNILDNDEEPNSLELDNTLDLPETETSYPLTDNNLDSNPKLSIQSLQNCLPINEILNYNDENDNDDITDLDSVMSCIQTSKDKLYMRNDHLIHFIPADCKLTTEVSHELIKENRINYEDLKIEPIENRQVGNVIVHRYEDQCVFHLIIKSTFDSKPYITDVINTLSALKIAMNELNIKSASISRVGNGLNQISWPVIEQELRVNFGQSDYKITICFGEVETPSENERENIIKEFHSSTTGGHKGATKTYARIRQQFYWANMREQIRDFVKNCETCKINKTVRIKTRLPMKITDTPSEAFEKI